MNIIEQKEHYSRKQNKEHFKHLIQVAIADGNINDSEMLLLHQLGGKMGFTEPEIIDLIESTKNEAVVPPYELSKRFEQMYEIVKMILADGKIDNNEMRLATRLAIKYGFGENETSGLLILLINGIKKGECEDDLFNIYCIKSKLNIKHID
jgi:uncharacterized tellurite resistance protein B-like protein